MGGGLQKLYAFRTKVGTFFIASKDGRFLTMLEDEVLDSYADPRQAVDDLVGGHGTWPATNVDPSKLGLADELSDWARLF